MRYEINGVVVETEEWVRDLFVRTMDDLKVGQPWGHSGTVHEPCIMTKPENIDGHHTSRIDSFTKIEGGAGVAIGAYVHIASYCHLNIGGGLLIMERGSSAGSGVKIVTGSNVPGLGRSCSAVAPGAAFKKSHVVIGRNAVLFVNAVVLPGVTVGDNAVVAAGAVVTRDVPPGEVWAGVPAKKVGMVRPIEDHTPYDEHQVAQMVLASIDELSGKG